MADLFISYRSSRQPAVRHLKRVLEAHGYSVWFDYALLSGAEFAPAIERELREAKAVIVIWCEHARDSRWVKEEADLALKLQTYLPVRLDQSELPLGFRLQDTIDLSDWDGDPRGNGLDRLIEQIRRKTGREPAPHYQKLVELQEFWRDNGKIAWAKLPLDEKLGAEIEAKRAAGNRLHLPVDGATGAQTRQGETATPEAEAKAATEQAKAETPQKADAPTGEGEGWQGHLPKWLLPGLAAGLMAVLALLLLWPRHPTGPKLETQSAEAAPVEAAPAFTEDAAASAPMAGRPEISALRVQAGFILKGHESNVFDAAFSPDGALLASASWDHTARIWRVSDGALLASLKHERGVHSAAFSPDGGLLATASTDKTARIWRVSDGALLASLKHENLVNSAAFSPDGALLASASWDNTARIWRVSDGALLATLKHENLVNSAAFSPDGRLLATASGDHTARIWRVSDGALLASLKHEGFVDSALSRPMAPCSPVRAGTIPRASGGSAMGHYWRV